MSSPAGSPPPYASSTPAGHKRRISLPTGSSSSGSSGGGVITSNTIGPAAKKHKPHRKASIAGSHPLRQTSFPPEEDSARRNRSPSVDSLLGNDVGVARRRGAGAAAADVVEGSGNHEEEDDEDRGDDYGTTSLLADGMFGGFGEDEERKQKLASAPTAFSALPYAQCF